MDLPLRDSRKSSFTQDKFQSKRRRNERYRTGPPRSASCWSQRFRKRFPGRGGSQPRSTAIMGPLVEGELVIGAGMDRIPNLGR